MAIEYTSKHGNIVLIQQLPGTDKLVVVQPANSGGFDDYFEILHPVTIENLIKIIRSRDRNEKDQAIIDDIDKFALSLLKKR